MECEKIPCAHVFRVLKFFGLRGIPRCCVAVRWTMQAKFGLEPKRNGNTQVWFDQMDRYRELHNKANSVLFKASVSMEKSNRVLEFFYSIWSDEAGNDENDDANKNGENNEAGTFGPLPAYFSSSSKAFSGKVLDPLPIKPRGAPTNKRPKAFHERFNSRVTGV
uniref:Uncharacterized protein n=1 Tax=Avena sativa TaxID=4498 RepID=A0ACD5YJD2_AVESA